MILKLYISNKTSLEWIYKTSGPMSTALKFFPEPQSSQTKKRNKAERARLCTDTLSVTPLSSDIGYEPCPFAGTPLRFQNTRWTS